eukprot:1149975-Pelagomonas_calceolata.AAC.5
MALFLAPPFTLEKPPSASWLLADSFSALEGMKGKTQAPGGGGHSCACSLHDTIPGLCPVHTAVPTTTGKQQ